LKWLKPNKNNNSKSSINSIYCQPIPSQSRWNYAIRIEYNLRLLLIFNFYYKKTIGWNATATILSGIIFTLLARLKPIILTFTAWALAIDDVITYFEGGESVLGDFINWLKNASPPIKVLIGLLASLGVALGGVFAVAKITAWGQAFKNSLDVMTKAFLLANTTILKTPLGQFLLAASAGVALGKIVGNKIGEYGEKHSGEGGITDRMGDSLLNGWNKITGWDKNLLPSSTNTTNSRINNNNINNSYTINSNQSPNDIATNITDEQQRAFDRILNGI
jgi:hypothetical protein